MVLFFGVYMMFFNVKKTGYLIFYTMFLFAVSAFALNVNAQESFRLSQMKKKLAQNDVRNIEIIRHNFEDVEVLDLGARGEDDLEQLEQILSKAQRVSINDSLDYGEMVVTEPYDPCPEFVGAGALGIYGKKITRHERCEIKKQLNKEQMRQSVFDVMKKITCTDPAGVIEQKNALLVKAQSDGGDLGLLRWERSIERMQKICKENSAEIFEPVFSVKDVSNSQFGDLNCRAALIEVKVLNGVGALGRWSFILGLDDCSGKALGFEFAPEKVVFDEGARNIYVNLLKTVSKWKGLEIEQANKVGAIFNSSEGELFVLKNSKIAKQ